MAKKALVLFLAGAWALAVYGAESLLPVGAEEPVSAATARPMPPAEAASTFVLGGFKAVLVDTLWVKADLLYREGRYQELWSLLDVLEALQPRNARVQEYTAWLQAYSLSLAEDDPARGWFWVQSALARLDRAERFHPDRPSLHMLRGRIYLEKGDPERQPYASGQVRTWRGEEALALASLSFRRAAEAAPHRAAPYVFWVESLLRRLECGGGPGVEHELDEVLLLLEERHPGVYKDLTEGNSTDRGTARGRE